jgi:hypothetical protein
MTRQRALGNRRWQTFRRAQTFVLAQSADRRARLGVILDSGGWGFAPRRQEGRIVPGR